MVGGGGGGGGASATAVDIAADGAVAANDDDAVNAVVPPSSTKDEDAYVGALVALEDACIGAFVDGAGESAAASVLLPPRCRCRAVPHRRASRCRHRRAVAKLPPTLPYHAAATATASALLQSRCRRRAVHRRNASRCRHRLRDVHVHASTPS